MERIVIGLPDLVIEKIVSSRPLAIAVSYTGESQCPHCNGKRLRIKHTFQRIIKSIPLGGKGSRLHIVCHKYLCKDCGRYFNTRLPGVRLWSRSTELLKKSVFQAYNKGYSCKDIAAENNIGLASVERFYHHRTRHKASHRQNRECPRILGIDEHRFTRKQGFSTTFCDLEKRRVFDIAKGRSAGDLETFLKSLRGRDKVEVVCIDMNPAYRRMVKDWFPNARIVADRCHVIRLVNHHFSEVCKSLEEASLAHGRGRLMRLLLMRRDRLNALQAERLSRFLEQKPAIAALYEYMHDLGDLLRVKERNARGCRKYVVTLLEKIAQLRASPFAALRTLGNTLNAWREEVARMFRYSKNNGITEGFHRKMKLIQRRAYGFRNFENYRLRVRVLCG